MKMKICFLVEKSCKMATHIEDVRYSINRVVNYIRFYNPDSEILFSLVTYHDSKHDTRITSRPWAPYNDFWGYLEDLEDIVWPSEHETEDVAGAVNFARESLDWSDVNSRQLFHYGISPAYGRQFHEVSVMDKYPNGGPEGINLLTEMYKFSSLPCDYTFFRISPMADTMLSLMDESYTGGGTFSVEDLETTEPYISEPDSEEE